MPWTPDDAPSHTHKATTPHLKKLWADVANKELPKVGEARAIKAANSIVSTQFHRTHWL
jgi:hypothetical protein